MVDADHVGLAQTGTDPLLPPTVTARFAGRPVEERVAPPLPYLAEVVGRHAGDEGRLTVGVEFEERPLHPDIGRVQPDEDGDVSDDADAGPVGGGAHRLPLGVDGELHQLHRGDGGRLCFGKGGERLRVAVAQRNGPLLPEAGAMPHSDDLKQGKVV